MSKKQTPDSNGKKTGGSEATQFKPGQVANPAGRPKGSRNKLSEQFIHALQQDFEKNGPTVIERVRLEQPAAYMKVIASILPKQVEIKEDAFDGISDAELAALIAAARNALGVSAGSGEEAAGAAVTQPPRKLPSVH